MIKEKLAIALAAKVLKAQANWHPNMIVSMKGI